MIPIHTSAIQSTHQSMTFLTRRTSFPPRRTPHRDTPPVNPQSCKDSSSTYHQGSSKMTVEAAVRLRPTPPALSDTSMTATLSSVAKLCLDRTGHHRTGQDRTGRDTTYVPITQGSEHKRGGGERQATKHARTVLHGHQVTSAGVLAVCTRRNRCRVLSHSNRNQSTNFSPTRWRSRNRSSNCTQHGTRRRKETQKRTST